MTHPGNDDSTITVHADTPEEVLKAGRQQIACGADFLKYFGTGTVGSEHGVPGALLTTKPELQALNDTAEAYGKYAAVHCHSKAGILLCAEVGIHTIEHASDIDDECIERILSHGSHSAIIPTLGPIGLMRSGMLGESIAKKVRETSCEQQKMLEASRVGVLVCPPARGPPRITECLLSKYTGQEGTSVPIRSPPVRPFRSTLQTFLKSPQRHA